MTTTKPAPPPEEIAVTTTGQDALAAPPHMATAYHFTLGEFRRDLVGEALGFECVKERHGEVVHAASTARRNGQEDAEAPPAVRDAYIAALMAGSYGYTLAAILAVAEQEFGLKVAERLAAVADDILTNGDDHDRNADVKPGVPLPPPTPAEQERAGQLRLAPAAPETPAPAPRKETP